jgi:hypothetical protein
MAKTEVKKKANIAMPSLDLAGQIALIGVLGHKDLGASCAFESDIKRTGMLEIMYFSVSIEAAYMSKNQSYN